MGTVFSVKVKPSMGVSEGTSNDGFLSNLKRLLEGSGA